MAAHALDDPFDGFRRRRAKRLPRWVGPAALGAIVLGMLLLFVLRAPTIEQRDRQNKIINVVLPPPPPPPPPPKQQQPQPEKPKLEEPKPTPVTPPPPSPTPPAANANDALSARTGAGPSNYGLAQGNGGGTRIGGGTGGNGYDAYGTMMAAEIQRTLAHDRTLAKDRYTARLLVRVGPDGTILEVHLADGSDDEKRDEALRSRLIGFQLSQRPPAGLPPVRVEFSSRPGL